MASSAPVVTAHSPTRSPDWYVLHVKRNHELRVVQHLTLKSVPAFLPLIEADRSRRRRPGITLEPLFPGYLFVPMEHCEGGLEDWHTVQWTPGVRLILGTDGTPVPVPGDVMVAIQERVSEYGFVRRGEPFQPCARVRFRTGPLVGLDALFEECLSRAGRVRVLMTLLGRQTRIEVDALDLECA